MSPARNRRQFLRTTLASVATGLAGCTYFEGPTSPTNDPGSGADGATETPDTPTDTPGGSPPASVSVETVATGFEAALDVAFAPEADRRYVAEQGGRVLVHDADGVRDEPFLDLTDVVETGSEKGLLGVELHPEFAGNRRVFVRYSAPSRSGTPSGYSHTFVLAEFTATEDGRRANRDTERTIIEIPQPQGNHNAGDLVFGPDGLLYVAVGDGGAAGDQGQGHVEDWYDAVPGGNGQDVTENLLGSILRVDVDGDSEGGYGIPDDNPLVGEDGLDEHYAWGLRNPWRMSFDPEGSRVDGAPDLYVGDVGQDRYGEVDLVRPGGNYGWNVREATHCYGADDCPDETPDGDPLLDPILEYPQSGADVSGVSVIGGYLYRGDAVPGLSGRYVFGDWQAGGTLFVAEPRGNGDRNVDRNESENGDGNRDGNEGGEDLWDVALLGVDDPGKVQRIRSFGRDTAGELYVVALGDDGWGLHRVVSA